MIQTKRNYGIDLLRLVSMFYVVVLHVLGKGGILKALEAGTAQYGAAWFMELWAYGAVNIFGIISGYVGFPRRKRNSITPITWSCGCRWWHAASARWLCSI